MLEGDVAQGLAKRMPPAAANGVVDRKNNWLDAAKARRQSLQGDNLASYSNEGAVRSAYGNWQNDVAKARKDGAVGGFRTPGSLDQTIAAWRSKQQSNTAAAPAVPPTQPAQPAAAPAQAPTVQTAPSVAKTVASNPFNTSYRSDQSAGKAAPSWAESQRLLQGGTPYSREGQLASASASKASPQYAAAPVPSLSATMGKATPQAPVVPAATPSPVPSVDNTGASPLTGRRSKTPMGMS